MLSIQDFLQHAPADEISIGFITFISQTQILLMITIQFIPYIVFTTQPMNNAIDTLKASNLEINQWTIVSNLGIIQPWWLKHSSKRRQTLNITIEQVPLMTTIT